jgi:hypothetical protein
MTNNYVDIPVPVGAPAPRLNPVGLEPLHWAKQNCPSYITNDAVQKQGEYYYRFYFGREQDQIMFSLRWS